MQQLTSKRCAVLLVDFTTAGARLSIFLLYVPLSLDACRKPGVLWSLSVLLKGKAASSSGFFVARRLNPLDSTVAVPEGNSESFQDSDLDSRMEAAGLAALNQGIQTQRRRKRRRNCNLRNFRNTLLARSQCFSARVKTKSPPTRGRKALDDEFDERSHCLRRQPSI